MSGRALEVWCFDRRAGTLVDDRGGMRFAYEPTWLGRQLPPLSQSLPLDGEFGAEATRAVFGGLLPEGAPRDVIARRLGVSAENDFALLEALGGDTAGAMVLAPIGEGPPEAAGDPGVRWLDDHELAREIVELPARPMHVDGDGGYRLSLAGAQDKLPVVVAADGRVGLTQGRTPSTHIMKTPIRDFADTVANEALCLDITARLGVPTAVAHPRRVEGQECLLVERHDRDRTIIGRTGRLHQEDFCQAIGVPSHRKYQREGGPTLRDCFALVRRATAVPGAEAVKLLDATTVNFLVGNHDAHGKNFSLLYRPGAPSVTLAPVYDVLSTVAYEGVRKMSRKLAMSWGTEYRPQYIRSRHLDALLTDAGVAPTAARRRIRGLAERAPEAARSARAELEARGWGCALLDAIVDVVDQRAQWLSEATVAPG